MGDANLCKPLDTPAQYFMKYFTMLERFSEETNNYSCRTTRQNLQTTSQEIQMFFGMSIITNLKFPRQRMYWHQITRVGKIATALPINRFQKILNNTHINLAADAGCVDCTKF